MDFSGFVMLAAIGALEVRDKIHGTIASSRRNEVKLFGRGWWFGVSVVFMGFFLGLI